MYSPLQPIFQRWLKMQCQMSNNSSQGLLVHYELGHKPTVFARLSLGTAQNPVVVEDSAMIGTAKSVLQKQRLHLTKTDESVVYLGYPIVMEGRFWGAVVIQVEACDSASMQAIIKLLKWGVTWLEFLVHSSQTSLLNDKGVTPTGQLAVKNNPNDEDQSQLFSLLMATIKESSLTASAMSTVNFIASHFDIERVSLGLCHSKSVVLTAVSFSTSFDARTESMLQVVGVMEEAVAQKTDVHLLKDARAAEPGEPVFITRAHIDILNKHHLKSIHTYLLRTQDHIVGVITLENVRGRDVEESTRSFVESSLPMLSSIYQIKRVSNKSIPVLIKEKVLNLLGRVFGCGYAITKISVAVFLALLVSFFIPAKFYITNDAVLDSVNKHLLVSPYEGFISDIYSQPGDMVEEGQLLAQLKDDDLSLERRKLLGQLQQYRLEYDNALANSNRVQAAILQAQVEQSQIALKLIEKKLARVKLISPIKGIIVSDDVSQSIGAPVSQGDILFEIADSAKYRVALYVDERSIRYFDKEQKGWLSLTSLPGEKVNIQIEKITPISEIRNSRNYFRVDASIFYEESLNTATTVSETSVEGATLEALRPGMTGTAKIYIDDRALAWIWFHDLWYWLRLTLWI